MFEAIITGNFRQGGQKYLQSCLNVNDSNYGRKT